MASASRKTSVGVVFGGRSTEHEVSRNSGRAIMAELDKEKYDVHPILITKPGGWIALPDPGRAARRRAGSPLFGHAERKASQVRRGR